ncbi:MAG TPA: hypothetical protein VGL79_03070, partial [Solirubrobacteraceae bacterium]
MTRWDWTWEDRSQAKHTPTADSEEGEEPQSSDPNGADSPSSVSGVATQPTPTDHVFRRRRAGAAGLAIVLLVVLIAALGSHKSSAKTHAATPKHDLSAPALTPAERAAATVRGEEKAVNSVLAYTPAVTSGGSHGNELALTFDDGPGPYTQQLVATLDR